jgi:predicted transcriptional regulator of viral defense system
MKRDLLEPFERIPYFTITSFMQAIEVDDSQTQRVREMLSRWAKSGHIMRLKKGVYMTGRFYDRHRDEEDFAPAVSAILLPQSYVSLEYVLQRAGALTEITYPITSVTAKNTRKIENAAGTFVYRHIKLSLYTGFRQSEYLGIPFSQASVGKALFDLLYLRPLPRSLRTRHTNLAEELRLNIDQVPREVKDEFAHYVGLSGSEKMRSILDNFWRTVWQT